MTTAPKVSGSKWNRDVCRTPGCDKPIHRDFKCKKHAKPSKHK